MTKAEQFFYDNAGYSYDPKAETEEEGRLRCAKQLAQAEEDAELAGITFEWKYDEDADWSWLDQEGFEEEKAKDHEVTMCLAKNPLTGETASLCGIFDADSVYRRVIQAELAMELL